ncbi:fasciclin domain-containing protein [Desertivirga brevis]|uniref:fasciclin domain-containing protein n=1 Tax=Desertivirga brevis TaxID=2810310 RepID=UPI001A960145|nr:fasciclin domain-containing protein [Pedobacter sp. SYSU D00873]
MNISLRFILLYLLSVVALFSSCEKKWDDHTELSNSLYGESLFDQIQKNPDLSKFVDLLKQTKYDSVLASSNTFTVWAPTNAAIDAVDPTYLDSDVKRKLFVGNHISKQSYLTYGAADPFTKIKVMNGKNVQFTKTAVDGITLLSKDLYVGNGTLHTIGSAILPKPNAWEYLLSTNTTQKALLNSYTETYLDSSKAEQIGVRPNTGEPIFKEGTGIVMRNRFLNRYSQASDISNEDSLFTYIILTDQAFINEKNKLSKYFKLGTDDSTSVLTDFNIIKDLAFKGILDADNFPANVYSIGDSVRFHLNKGHIVETKRVSNGIVYVMNNINYDLGSGTYDPYTKIKPIVIEGERGAFFSPARTFNTVTKRNPNGSSYQQLYLSNHGVNALAARYRPSFVNSVKYKVYWRVVRDFNLSVTGTATNLVHFPMRLAFKTSALTTGFNYIPEPGVVRRTNSTGQPVLDVNGKPTFDPDYSEVYLGEFTADKVFANRTEVGDLKDKEASMLPIFLVGNTTTGNGTNTLLLDYIKLVPVLP